jgi:uncharacterized membrane protein YdbT with pleckstrin-like domain
MNHTVTEKDYPIQVRWIVKVSIAPVLLAILLLILLGISLNGEQNNGMFILYFPIIFVLIAGQVVVNALKRSCLHYSLEDAFMVVRQGVLVKQERRIHYGKIQDISVRRQFSDRIFGIASLMIENAAQGSLAISPSYILGKHQAGNEIFGSVGNVVNIPGLGKNDAELLKEAISQKIKENPAEGTSGL